MLSIERYVLLLITVSRINKAYLIAFLYNRNSIVIRVRCSKFALVKIRIRGYRANRG